ncbi:hypothetical protein SAMN05421505_11281 [Sinosporangium album]|uniref:Uncharacterized protein n=1 Tax=Sinosporangium album TaxID=504805 RepID=A0A1G8AAR6_9ACTN|nr:hypothetical protein [Sinosporangium album]SDH17977.1 hypothetical protein SAMN05421505_11281 [Sinosporangium album]
MALAEDAGRIAASQYVGIEAEDISAHVILHACENSELFERHLDHDAWLWSVLYATAIRYCNKQTIDWMYYSGQYVYTPQEVRDLLIKAHTTNSDIDDYVKVNDATVAVIDLVRAFGDLRPSDQDVIRRKLDGEPVTETERKQYYRATEYLTRLLNKRLSGPDTRTDGPGTRKALSNSQAIAATQVQT